MYLHPGIPLAPRAPGEESEGMGDDWDWGENGSPKVVSIGGVPIEDYARTKGLASSPVAESGLPKGDEGGKGIGLNPDIPGEKTYKKPEDDIRDFDHSKSKNDSDPWRRDSPDDQLKERDVVDDKEDWGLQHDGIGEMGKDWDPNDTKKTKYPYRDGLPHQHFASEQNEFIVGMYLVDLAHGLRVRPGNRLLVAAKPDEVITGLNPAFAQRARSCGVTLKRADVGNMRWLFSVNCGNGAKVVKLKAFRAQPNLVRMGKMDVDLSCSCPAWQWLGPEHHAKGEDYLDGSPRGTASTPVVRDPQGINRVCKHVAAVLSFVQAWEVPPRPKKK